MLICLQQLLVLSVVPTRPSSPTLHDASDIQDALPNPPVDPVPSLGDKLKQS